MLEQLSQELASLEARSLRRRLQVLEEVLPGGRVQLGRPGPAEPLLQ